VSDGVMIKHYVEVLEDGINVMTTSPDNKYLFVGGDAGGDGGIGVGCIDKICLESQKVGPYLGKVHGSYINCLQTTRDSKSLITASSDMSVKRISTNGKYTEKHFSKVCDADITAMKISADEQKVLLGDRDGNLKLMSLTDGTIIKDFGKIHDDQINGIVTTADEMFFFTSSCDGQLQQWSHGDATLVRDYGKIADGIRSLCF
jgi:WD40 repeat protein